MQSETIETGARDIFNVEGFHHILITRFSVRIRPPDRKSQDPLQEEKLRLRFKTFELSCLPSVLAQTSQDFTWVIIVDRDLPEGLLKKLRRLVAPKERVVLYTFNSQDRIKDGVTWLEPFIPSGTNYLLTTNLDDDDVLPDDFVAEARRYWKDRIVIEQKFPPLLIMGCKKILHWELVKTRQAPLGWKTNWARGDAVSSCGFSLLCKLPGYSMNVLALSHSFAEQYLDWTVELRNPRANAIRQQMLQAAEMNGDKLKEFDISQTFHDLSPEVGPVLMTNHVYNLERLRLFEPKSDMEPVEGDHTFPGLSVSTRTFQRYSASYEKGFRYFIKAFLASISMVRLRIKRIARRV